MTTKSLLLALWVLAAIAFLFMLTTGYVRAFDFDMKSRTHIQKNEDGSTTVFEHREFYRPLDNGIRYVDPADNLSPRCGGQFEDLNRARCFGLTHTR